MCVLGQGVQLLQLLRGVCGLLLVLAPGWLDGRECADADAHQARVVWMPDG